MVGAAAALGQLTANGGFVPKGGVAILSGIVIVIFAFVGAEIATIAAAESKEPGEAVRKRDELGDRARARPSTCCRSS